MYGEEEAPEDIEVIVDEVSHYDYDQYDFNQKSQALIVSGGCEGAFNMGKKKANQSKPVVVHDEGVEQDNIKEDPQEQNLLMHPHPCTLASHLSYSAFDNENIIQSSKK